MRRLTALSQLTAGVLITTLCVPMPSFAQTHRVQDPGSVTRAISVFEWTGDDIKKPAAARLVPISLFIHGHFEDAGVYMAQPIPLALDPDTRYFLQKSGVNTGVVDLSFARNLKAPGSAVASNYDDGWFGYGKWQPLPRPKSEAAPAKIDLGDDTRTSRKAACNDRPAAGMPGGRRGGIGGNRIPGGYPNGGGNPGGGNGNSSDCDKQSGKDSSRNSGSDQASAKEQDAPDPDRPTFKKEEVETGDPRKDRRKQDKKSDVSGVEAVPGGPGSETAGGAAPTDDSDRPVFRKRTASEAPTTDTVGVTEKRTELLGDPTRPTLHRGRPAGSVTGEDLGALKGLAENMHQAVAVSDAKDRPEHDFTHKFADDAEREKVKAALEAMARAVIANPCLAVETANSNANPEYLGIHTGAHPCTLPIARAGNAAPKSAVANGAVANGAKTPAATRRKASTAKKTAMAPVPAVALEDETFAAFDLAYNSVPTYVLTARTAGEGEAAKYVTVVASPDTFGMMQPVMRSLTDAAHLNVVPRLRLVDVVDPDASNRASLLFELRRQNSRFFALYRVYGAKAQQIFMSGITQ